MSLNRSLVEFIVVSVIALSLAYLVGCGSTDLIKPKSCTVTATLGGSLISCPDGSNAFVKDGSPGSDGLNGVAGKDGQDGEQGTPGVDGAAGLQGVPGTAVTSVKLCPGVTVYPSQFIEIAFCIDSSLYAVYSTHGGFMTELPPGNYQSNAVGSACNFTVLPNCGISH